MTEAAHPEARVGMKAKGYTVIFLVLIGVTLASLLTGEILIARNSSASGVRTSIILGISTVKALLIVMFYMHLKFEPRPVQVVAAIPLLFLAILMVILTAFPNPTVAVAAAGGHGPPQPEVPPVPGGAVRSPEATGGVAAGQAIFQGKSAITTPCSACHSTGPERVLGPGLKGVGAKGEEYIRESIVNPSAKIAAGDPPYLDAMPKTFAKELCGKDTKDPAEVAGCMNLDDLVAYLVSMKG